MINIITGKVNSGKTTKLIDIFKNIGKGDGFYNRKIYIDGHYIGQEIVILSTGKSKVWSLKKGIPTNWNKAFSYEKYSFSEGALEFVEKVIVELIASEAEPIYIDEIGPLELEGKGFNNLFLDCLESKKELYVVIREGCLQEVIKKYSLKNYNVIKVRSGEDTNGC